VPAVKDPNADIRNAEGALFCFEMLSMIDSAFVIDPDIQPAYRADLHKRGFVRGIITPEYKFARYFSPLQFNSPTDIDTLYKYNDVELYEYGSDETNNLAWPKGSNTTLVNHMNQRLNALIQHEIGADDGHEVKMGGGYRGGIRLYSRN
jgi:arylsulfatase